MQKTTNHPDWLTTALAVEQPLVNDDKNTDVMSEDKQDSPKKPAATPTTEEKAVNEKTQLAELDQIYQVSIPDAANQALPALNESLHFLTNELYSRDDLRLNEDSAKALALEIMAVWLNASHKGPVSNLASIVVKSPRINTILSTIL